MMAKPSVRPSILSAGSFGAFVLDQLSELGDVVARPMFGGAGFYLDGEFFGLLYEERLYFRVSPDTIGEYTTRKMSVRARLAARGESRGRCVEITEPGRSDEMGARHSVHPARRQRNATRTRETMKTFTITALVLSSHERCGSRRRVFDETIRRAPL